MDRFESIKAIVDTYIKANGNGEITGEVLNNVLNAMLDDISNAINSADVGGGNSSASIIVDTMMSDMSSNPVQNRVIKAYVDTIKIELDAIVGGDATNAIDSINDILAFLSTMTDADTLAGIVANLKKMIQEGDDSNIRYTDNAFAALKTYSEDYAQTKATETLLRAKEYADTADNIIDKKIGNLTERVDDLESQDMVIDDAMSGNSDNPVQNKIIKSYIDDADVRLEGYVEEQVNGLEESVNRKIGDVETTIEQLDSAVSELDVKIGNLTERVDDQITNLIVDFHALSDLVNISPNVRDVEMSAIGLTSNAITRILNAKYNKIIDADTVNKSVWNYTAFTVGNSIRIQFMQGDRYDVYNSYSLSRDSSGYWTIIFNEI